MIQTLNLIEHPLDVADDHQMPLLEHRQWTRRNNRRQLPAHFKDIIPQPPPPLPLAQPEPNVSSNTSSAPIHMDQGQMDTSPSLSLAAHLGLGLCRIFQTPHNIFGLSRRYKATELPSFDAEEQIALQHLSDIPVWPDSSEVKAFYPYPNCNAFELGNWHWNGSAQKSQSSL